MVADGIARLARDQIAPQWLFVLARHPLIARHHRQPPQVVERLYVIGMDAGGLEAAPMERRAGVRPFAHPLEFEKLQLPQLLARHRLVLGIPVGTVRHGYPLLRNDHVPDSSI